MSEPISLPESLAISNLHITDNKIAIIVGIDQYHNVASHQDDSRSAFSDQPRCISQITEIEDFVEKFNFSVIKYINPDYETLDRMMKTVQ